MPARKPRPPNEKPQRERFIEAAREHGASEDPEDFERVFAEVMKPGSSRLRFPHLVKAGSNAPHKAANHIKDVFSSSSVYF